MLLKRIIFKIFDQILKKFGFTILGSEVIIEMQNLKRLNKELNRRVIRLDKFIQSKWVNEYSFDVFRSHAIDILSGFSKSQDLQDIKIDYLLRKKNGFYVEFGADDGIKNSNTHYLEKLKGWSGILAEPNPKTFLELQLNRPVNSLSSLIVFEESGLEVDFICSGQLSTIKSFKDDDHNSADRNASIEQILKIGTISLLDLLKTHNAPKIIDFLSIDTEGSEYAILSNFDFSSYQINVICVEHNRGHQMMKIKNLLEGKGYSEFIFEEEAIDSFYVHKSVNVC